MKNSNESAYPTQCPNSAAGKLRGGLTKREYFAAMAMQGLLSTMYSQSILTELAANTIAKESVLAADALLTELEKTNPNK